MKILIPLMTCGVSALFLTAHAPDVSAQASDLAETACMSAVNDNYGGNVRNLDIVSSEFSQANSVVVINADGEHWRCLVSNDGNVEELTVQESHGSSGSGNSSSGGSFDLSGRAMGHCKLINVQAGRQLYNGRCSHHRDLQQVLKHDFRNQDGVGTKLYVCHLGREELDVGA